MTDVDPAKHDNPDNRVREFAQHLTGIGGNCPADLVDYPGIAERFIQRTNRAEGPQ